MSNNLMNTVKREKKFNKEMSLYVSHPYYNDIKQLYINNVIKTITSAEAKIKKIKITTKGKVYKTSIKKAVEVKKDIKNLFEQQNKKLLTKFEREMNELKQNQRVRVSVNLKKLTENNKKLLISSIIKLTNDDKKYLMRIDETFYTLNDKTKKRLAELVEPEKIAVGSTPISVSDAEIEYALIDKKKLVISILHNKAKNKKSSGEFFRYLNKTDIDLSEYQIYNKEQFNEVKHDECCLYYALKSLGLDEVKLNSIKILIKNRNIPQSDLNKICDKIKIRINLKKPIKNRNEVFIYGKQYYEVYNIGLIENHYFKIIDTKYTSYCINNYDNVKHLENFNNIYRLSDGKYKKRNDKFIDSYDLIKLFVDNKDKLLELISFDNCNIAYSQFYDKIDEEITNLNYDVDECCRLVVKDKKEKKEDEFYNIYFDFETYKDSKNRHVAYLLCAYYENEKISKSFYGPDCALEFLKSINYDARLIAHNVSYDYRFIIDHLYNVNEISRGNKLIGCSAKFNKFNIKIKDSYHLLGMGLSKFPKVFGLKSIKEVMPYDIYNLDNLNKKWVDYEECIKYVKKDDIEQFNDNLKKWDLLSDNKVDIITYSVKYCEIDVELLHKGYTIFKGWMNEHFKINIEDCLTIASLAHQYLINTNCYDEIYELSGVPQMFIQGCVVGGRCMCNNNEKQTFNILDKFDKYTHKRMQDFDAVSLYPSAMKRMKGFLKGCPKVIENLSYDYIKNYDGYFVEIKINKVGIKRAFSLMSYKNEEGIRMFTNDMEGKIIKVDKTTLEDLIKFQKIEFEIIRGYYFNEGFNNKINEVIEYIFSKRLELKAMVYYEKNKDDKFEKEICLLDDEERENFIKKLKKNNISYQESNPAELTYKLIMNNAYGKSIMKPIETETKLFTREKEFEVYIDRNYNWINSYNKFGKNNNKYKVKIIKKLDDHYNIAHVGVEILSMSKRIMNEVMTIAEDNNLKIYYQDTDSMHIEQQDIKILQEQFNKTYERELIGKNMGQFHSDFDLKGCEDVYASRSLFLGKKSYIDELKGIDEKGNIKTGYHIRMKGIPNSCIEYTTKKEGYETPFDLYLDLYNGKEISFDLCEGGKKANFEFKKDYSIYTKTEFLRTIKF